MKIHRQIAIVALFLFAFCAFAQNEDQRDDRVEKAVDKAIAYLISQQKDDGEITKRRRNRTTMTALAVMAMASAGHMADDPTPEGKAMRKAIEYVIDEKHQKENGYFGNDGSRMYGHGIVTLMLAELLGMGVNEKQDRIIRQRLVEAIKLIVWSQNQKKHGKHRGGWRYQPNSNDSDLSVTIWQLLALRAARNAGIPVPRSSIKQAIEYLKISYKSKRNEEGKPLDMKSACAYQPGSKVTYASGAAGLLALQVCGEYDAPEVIGSADWLMEKEVDKENSRFYYGTYYYAQGMYQRGGEYAKRAREQVVKAVLRRQKNDGSWQDGNGEVYATSMAVLSLSVRFHYLPIYQR